MTQRKLPTCVEAEAGASSPACTERRLDEGARALGGGIGGAGSIWSKVTIETGWSSVKPEKVKRTAKSCARKKAPRYAWGWVALKRSPYNIASLQHRGLPAVHGAVEFAIDGQVCAAIRVGGGELLVDIDA